MANWAKFHSSISGELAQLEKLKTTINTIKKKDEDGDESLSFEPWGVEDEWCLLLSQPMIKNGQLNVLGECKWYPPIKGLQALSKEFPGVELHTTFTVEDEWDAGDWFIQNGFATLTEHRRGYFSTMSVKKGDPIHLWVAMFNNQEVSAALTAAGLTIRREGQTIIRNMDAVTEFVNHHFPQVAKENLEAVPYTLNEEIYLESVQTISESHRPGTPEAIGHNRRLADLIAIAERDISLTHEEVLTLLSRIAKKPPSWVSLGIVWDRYRHYLVRVGNYQTGLFKEPPQFHPTALEIRLLLSPRISSTPGALRNQELNDALHQPRWTKAWPRWEMRDKSCPDEQQPQ